MSDTMEQSQQQMLAHEDDSPENLYALTLPRDAMEALEQTYKDPRDLRDQAFAVLRRGYGAFASKRNPQFGELLFDVVAEKFSSVEVTQVTKVRDQVRYLRRGLAEIINDPENAYKILEAHVTRDVQDYESHELAGYRSQEEFEADRIAVARHLKRADLVPYDVLEAASQEVTVRERLLDFIGFYVPPATAQEIIERKSARLQAKNAKVECLLALQGLDGVVGRGRRVYAKLRIASLVVSEQLLKTESTTSLPGVVVEEAEAELPEVSTVILSEPEVVDDERVVNEPIIRADTAMKQKVEARKPVDPSTQQVVITAKSLTDAMKVNGTNFRWTTNTK